MHSVRRLVYVLVAISLIGVLPYPARANDPAPSGRQFRTNLTHLRPVESRRHVLGRRRKWAAYAIDNETSSSRLGIAGTHRLSSRVSLGFRVEIDSRLTSSSEVSRGDAWGDASGAIELRHAYGYIEDSKVGRLTLGQQSPATDDITLFNLGSEMNNAALHYNNRFGVWLNRQRL